MSQKCYFQYDGSRFCKNWAQQGSRFCRNHQPPGPTDDTSHIGLHPYARLAMPRDVFHLVSESLNAVRLGSMTPAKAYAIGYLSTIWLKLHALMGYAAREDVLRHQILASLVDAESAARAEQELPPPDPDPPAAQAAQPRATADPPDAFDPWAAGRMAGPAPSRDAGPVPPDEPINLQEAQARLAELLGFQPDDEDQPLVPAPLDPSRSRPSVAAGLPRHSANRADSPALATPDPSQPPSKPNGSAASRPPTKARDPAA